MAVIFDDGVLMAKMRNMRNMIKGSDPLIIFVENR